jgi:CxxC motif-containing protein
MKSEFVKCSICPVGCRLEIRHKNGDIKVTGNRCGRGLEYAAGYNSADSAFLRGRCLLENGPLGRLPVVSSAPVPQALVDEMLAVIQQTSVSAPVEKGQIVIKNILGSGIDVLSQRRVGRNLK